MFKGIPRLSGSPNSLVVVPGRRTGRGDKLRPVRSCLVLPEVVEHRWASHVACKQKRRLRGRVPDEGGLAPSCGRVRASLWDQLGPGVRLRVVGPEVVALAAGWG